ncbi:UNVERIFIED_CONTAM: hypothetical protein Sradi_2494200 [Sesamum radiatum]|uniref:Reverse transcriptase domain-containing protein n=1 Tax=Sesamum radiatum TaxID=300843 RepID=A0AAW2SJU7_SESRA
MTVPKEDGGDVPCRVDIEYEWVPLKCRTCNSLGHQTSQCPATKPSTKPPITLFVPRQKVENEGSKADKGRTPEEPIIRTSTAPSDPVLGVHVREQQVPPNIVGDGRGKEIVIYNLFEVLMDNGDGIECSRKGPKQSSPQAWKDDELDVDVLTVHEQVIHCRVFTRQIHTAVMVSVVYGVNDLGVRKDLYRTLSHIADSIDVEPWLALGDFNAVANISEVCGGSWDIRSVIEDFQGFLIDTSLITLPMQGALFTWHNCSDTSRSLWKRLDRMLVNDQWLDRWSSAFYISLTPRTSDHSPLIFKRNLLDNHLVTSPPCTLLPTGIYEGSQVRVDYASTESRDPMAEGGRSIPVTKEDIKLVTFDIIEDKSLGSDNYSSGFYKVIWPVIAEEVTGAIMEFFYTGRLLRKLNVTLLALIPKVQSPSTVSEFQPISCCNVVYKAITKILVQRIREVLDKIISPSQNAFVSGCSIDDNILLAQKLFMGYNKKHLSRRCALKVDLRKAYDTVEWDFLIAVIHVFGSLQLVIHWIKECVTTPTFSICLNGAAYGFFAGARRLRQGDPMSPYLFVLVIEVLHMLLQQLIDQDRDFMFHWKCRELRIF